MVVAVGFGLRRQELQTISAAKLADAKILLSSERFSNAYYLGGYAVEIALKACIAKQFSADTIPDKNFINAIYSHKLKELIGLAGLTREFQEQERNNRFAANWAVVVEWTPESRYTSVDPYSAQFLIHAIDDEADGVMTWIKNYW